MQRVRSSGYGDEAGVQTTIKSAVQFTGTGLHSGRPVRMVIRPAAAHFGVWFRRTDLKDGTRSADPGAL